MTSSRTQGMPQGLRAKLAGLAAVSLLLSTFLTVVMPLQQAAATPALLPPLASALAPSLLPALPPLPCLCGPGDTDGDEGEEGGGGTPIPPNGPRPPGGGDGGSNRDETDQGEVWDYWGSLTRYWFPRQPPANLLIPASVPGLKYYSARASYNAKCSGTTPYGKYLGVETSHGGLVWIERPGGPTWPARPRETTQQYASYRCIDPPHYKDIPRKCAATVGATAVGPYKNPDVAATTFYTSGPVKSPFANSTYKNLSLCDDAFEQMFQARMTHLGQYKLTPTGTQVTCTIRHYTTRNARTKTMPADKILRCSAAFPYSRSVVKTQLWCDGWSMGWGGSHSFTDDECRNPVVWDCGSGFPKVPKYNGVSVPPAGIEILDDGVKRPATWTVPRPRGALRKLGSRKVELFMDPKSSPSRKGDPNGLTQPFVASPALNSLLTGWSNHNSWKLGFQAPSTPGKMWVATPTWSFVADFKRSIIEAVSVNWDTGEVTPRTSVDYVTGPGTCPGLPLSLSAHRARNIN